MQIFAAAVSSRAGSPPTEGSRPLEQSGTGPSQPNTNELLDWSGRIITRIESM